MMARVAAPSVSTIDRNKIPSNSKALNHLVDTNHQDGNQKNEFTSS